ncbi:transposase [Streptomyces sp. NPDC057430]|uniref:transposase n=1 Tax=Streptomyces sp. NPDC057430 TaxID=3346131 RepID=UPI0036C8E845
MGQRQLPPRQGIAAVLEHNSDWLTIVKLPPYAPDLNPVEGLWAHLKTSLANLAPRTSHLAPRTSHDRRPDPTREEPPA